MKIDGIGAQGTSLGNQKFTPAEQVDSQRKATRDQAVDTPQASAGETKVQPEELLDAIKSITQDGLYHVRFEQFKDSKELVVKIMDNETDEVIRQIPPEELMELRLTFEELVGNAVNAKA